MATPKVIKNFNLTVQGVGFIGLVTNVTLPSLTIVTDEHRAGGMDMPIMLDMGMEAMELSFEVAEQNPDIIRNFGLNNQNGVQLIFRAAMQNDTETTPYVIVARGMISNLELGDVTVGEKNSITVTVSLRYLKIVENLIPLVEIDVDNMKRVIAGVDELRAERDAIGLSSLNVFNSITSFLS